MRLKSAIWVAAYIRRCNVEGAFAAVRRRGADRLAPDIGGRNDGERRMRFAKGFNPVFVLAWQDRARRIDEMPTRLHVGSGLREKHVLRRHHFGVPSSFEFYF